jgi:hypothetical protein
MLAMPLLEPTADRQTRQFHRWCAEESARRCRLQPGLDQTRLLRAIHLVLDKLGGQA